MSQLFTDLTAEQESTISGGTPPCWAPAHGYRRNKDKHDKKDKDDKCKVVVICPPKPCYVPPKPRC